MTKMSSRLRTVYLDLMLYRTSTQVSAYSMPTAAIIPAENPCCSCKLTRVRTSAQIAMALGAMNVVAMNVYIV